MVRPVQLEQVWHGPTGPCGSRSRYGAGYTWNRAVKVKDYARYGAGLYRVHGVSDGASACDGAVLIKVGGSPLTTLFGLGAAGFVVVGLANIAATLRGGRKAVAS